MAMSEPTPRAEPRTPRTSIVIGLDGHEHDADALALGRTLQSSFGGEIVLAHVVPPAPPGRGMVELEALELHDGRHLLDTALAGAGESCDAELIHPWPVPLALARLAIKRHAGLIVLGTSDRRSIGRILPGSVASRLVKETRCAIAVAPLGYGIGPAEPIARIGVAYNGSTGSGQALLDAATAAARLEVPLYVYYATRPDSPPDEVAADAAAILERALRQIPSGVDATARQLAGEPVAAIGAAAREDRISLLFAGSRGRGPLREALSGGFGGPLLHDPPCAFVLVPQDSHPLAAFDVTTLST